MLFTHWLLTERARQIIRTQHKVVFMTTICFSSSSVAKRVRPSRENGRKKVIEKHETVLVLCLQLILTLLGTSSGNTANTEGKFWQLFKTGVPLASSAKPALLETIYYSAYNPHPLSVYSTPKTLYEVVKAQGLKVAVYGMRENCSRNQAFISVILATKTV